MFGLTEKKIVDQLKSRNPELLTRLIEDHNDALLGVSWGMGWQGVEAEDLVQDTWVTFLKSLDTFEGRSSIKTYLIGILYHKALEKRRAMHREQVADPIDDVFEQRFGMWGVWRTLPRGPEDEASARESMELITTCLQSLTQDQRMAFYLKEVERSDTESICNILGVTVPHLGVLLFRARNKVRECIQRRWKLSHESTEL
jgi:RNA polymerase sigma-70 factor (ECF subfamily)